MGRQSGRKWGKKNNIVRWKLTISWSRQECQYRGEEADVNN